MMTLCLRYTKNEADALEVLNSGFYKVFRSIRQYDADKAAFYTWVRTIIINSCLDLVKAQQNKSGTGKLDEAVTVHVPPSVISKMTATEILALVRELPASTQAVFNLYVLEGYSHNEISSLMGMSEGTSKWHLSEARKKLQKMIKEQMSE
jgi:RNA polymerase sigma-70 factor (ECF subfamily)